MKGLLRGVFFNCSFGRGEIFFSFITGVSHRPIDFCLFSIMYIKTDKRESTSYSIQSPLQDARALQGLQYIHNIQLHICLGVALFELSLLRSLLLGSHLLRYLTSFSDELPKALDEALLLIRQARPARSPPYPALRVDKIGISDLAVEQADRLLDVIANALPHEEIPPPILLAQPSPQRSHEQRHEPRLHRVILNVHPNNLSVDGVAGEHFRQGRVHLLGDERVDLLLTPLAAEDGDDGGAAPELRSGVTLGAVLVEGLAVKVGEIEGLVGPEEARRGDEGFAVVVLEIGPVAEVRT